MLITMITVLSWNVNRFRCIGSTLKLSYILYDWVFFVLLLSLLLFCLFFFTLLLYVFYIFY